MDMVPNKVATVVDLSVDIEGSQGCVQSFNKGTIFLLEAFFNGFSQLAKVAVLYI